MGDILIERLNGIEFSHVKYLPYRNPPDPTSTAYRYVAGPRDDTEKTDSQPSASFLIQRKVTPPVPPVLRLPTFTAPPPFHPPETVKKPEPKPAPPPVKEEKSLPACWGSSTTS